MGDSHSIDVIIHTLYETISGPAGQERDWSRFGALFFPGARLVRTLISPDGTPRALAMDVRAYAEDTAPYFRHHSFYEAEITRRVERFGCIAQVFSTYEARHEPTDATPIKRGINSIQMFNDGNRWWLISVLWDNERDDLPLPPEYLP